MNMNRLNAGQNAGSEPAGALSPNRDPKPQKPLEVIIGSLSEMECRVIGLTNRLSEIISRLVGYEDTPDSEETEKIPTPPNSEYVTLKCRAIDLNKAIDGLNASVNRAEAEL